MELTFNSVTDKEFAAVSDLIMNMYNQHLRRYYTEEGDANFTKQASIPELKRKSQKGCFLFIVKEEEDIIRIRANIYTERNTQKGIIVGAQGSMRKKTGTGARKRMRAFFKKKVFLDLFVKVRKNWRANDADLKRFGYKR